MNEKSVLDNISLSWWRTKSFFRYHTLKHWEYILWACEGIILVILVILACRFRAAGWNNVGILLTVLFGLISGASLIFTLMVLHSIRNLIVDYLQAGHSIREVIKNAAATIFILSENPAFLQAARPEILDRWLTQLRDRLSEPQFIRVVFAYIYREQLVGVKFPKWAPKVNTTVKKMSDELRGNFTFNLCENTKFRPKVFMVPLMTSSIPFYLAVADTDKNGLFCRSEELDPDVRRWRLRGFSTSDPHIASGLKEVFLKFLQLNAIAYTYECASCKGKVYLYNRNEQKFEQFQLSSPSSQLKVYLFDHDLLVLHFAGEINMTDLQSTPPIKCPSCNTFLDPTPTELKDIREEFVITSDLAQFTGTEIPQDLIKKPYTIGKALFWIVTGEEWKD